MKKLFIIIMCILGLSVVYTTSSIGDGWPGHHRGVHCFIETSADNSAISQDNADGADVDNLLAQYRRPPPPPSGGYNHGSNHNSHHHHHGCFIDTTFGSNWWDELFGFLWKPRQ